MSYMSATQSFKHGFNQVNVEMQKRRLKKKTQSSVIYQDFTSDFRFEYTFRPLNTFSYPLMRTRVQVWACHNKQRVLFGISAENWGAQCSGSKQCRIWIKQEKSSLKFWPAAGWRWKTTLTMWQEENNDASRLICLFLRDFTQHAILTLTLLFK